MNIVGIHLAQILLSLQSRCLWICAHEIPGGGYLGRWGNPEFATCEEISRGKGNSHVNNASFSFGAILGCWRSLRCLLALRKRTLWAMRRASFPSPSLSRLPVWDAPEKWARTKFLNCAVGSSYPLQRSPSQSATKEGKPWGHLSRQSSSPLTQRSYLREA